MRHQHGSTYTQVLTIMDENSRQYGAEYQSTKGAVWVKFEGGGQPGLEHGGATSP